MKGDRPAWLVAVSKNRDSLERIAKHGQTGLAHDVARLLEEAERMEAQYDVPVLRSRYHVQSACKTPPQT